MKIDATQLLSFAAEHGVDRSRVHLVPTLDDFLATCREFSDPHVDRHTDYTHAVNIQLDDLPGGPDFHIIMRFPLHESLAKDTFTRLIKRGVLSERALTLTQNEESLAKFILLHEVAHNRLAHGPGGPSELKEIEADHWALKKLGESKGRKPKGTNR